MSQTDGTPDPRQGDSADFTPFTSPSLIYLVGPTGALLPAKGDAQGRLILAPESVGSGAGAGGGTSENPLYVTTTEGTVYPAASDPRHWPQDTLAVEEEYDLADGAATNLQTLWSSYNAFYTAGVVTRWTVQVLEGTIRLGMTGNVTTGKGRRLKVDGFGEFNRSEFGTASSFVAEDGPATILVCVYYVGSNPTGD